MKKNILFKNFMLILVLLCVCVSSYAQAVSISISISPNTICGGSATNLSIASISPAGSYTYQWDFDHGPGAGYVAIPGATNASLTDTPSGSGSYRLRVFAGGVLKGTSNSVGVTVNSGPGSSVISASNSSFCWGDSAVLSGTSVSGATYQWYMDGSPISGATTRNDTAKFLTSGTHVFNLHTIGASCFSVSNNLSVTEHKPTSLISASEGNSFCANPTIPNTLTVPAAPGNTYQWLLNNANIPGAIFSTYDVYALSPNTGFNYSVIVTDSFGCSTSGYVTLHTMAAPNITVSASGPTTICNTENVTLTASPNSTRYNYTWSDETGMLMSGLGTMVPPGAPAGPPTQLLYPPAPPSSAYDEHNVMLEVDDIGGPGGPPAPCPLFINTVVTTHYCGSCSPDNVFPGQAYTPIGQTGSFSGSVIHTGGYYYLSSPTGTITISGTLGLTSAVILVDANTTIDVVSGGTLSLMACHIFSCSGNMWNGITAEDNSHVGLSYCIIEDAKTGFETKQHTFTGSVEPQLFNNIFNRNNKGIAVNNPNIEPVVENGNIFTSRDISTYPGYPGPYALYADLKAPYSGGSFSAPYAIGNNTYPYVACRDSSVAVAGVWISNYNLTFPVCSVTGGQSNSDYFDNLRYGVYVSNSNATISSSIFMNMRFDDNYFGSGTGVYATDDGTSQTKVVVGNISDAIQNQFYIPSAVESAMAVYGNNMYKLFVQNTKIVSDQSFSAYSSGTIFYNNYGIGIEAYNYDSVEIANNLMLNLSNGVVLYQEDNGTTANAGYTDISFNHFLNGGSNAFFGNTIDVENYSSLPVVSTGDVTILNNEVEPAFYGIKTYGFQTQKLSIKNNMIRLVNDPHNGGFQYGVETIYNVQDTVKENLVMGNGVTAADITDHAYHIEAASGSQVLCNNANAMGVGFYFNQCQYDLTWHNNSMSGYRYGMELDGGGIGQQGSAMAASDNTWAGTKYDTWVAGGANASSSILYVQSGVPYQPSINSGVPVSAAYTVGSSIITGASAGVACGSPKAMPTSVANVNMEAQKYTIFPNPGNGYMQIIRDKADGNAAVQVMTVDGRTIYSATLTFKDYQSNLNINGMKPGLYMVQIKDENGGISTAKYIIKE